MKRRTAISSVKRPPTPTAPATLEVTDVAVFGDDDLTPLLVLKDKDLAAHMQLVRLGISPPTVKLQEGQSGVVFLDIALPNRRSIPKQVTNRVWVAAVPGTGDQPVIALTKFAVDIDQTPEVVIGPFLRGGAWSNFNGCCDFATPHRRIAASQEP